MHTLRYIFIALCSATLHAIFISALLGMDNETVQTKQQSTGTPWVEVVNQLNYAIDVKFRCPGDASFCMDKIQSGEMRRIDSFPTFNFVAIWVLGAFRSEAVVWWDNNNADNARYTVGYSGISDYVRVKHEAYSSGSSGQNAYKIDFYVGDRPVSFREGID